MKKVMVECPYSGELELNRAYAVVCMADCIFRKEAPFLSHLFYAQILEYDKEDERNMGFDLGQVWAASAELTVVYTDRGISPGMKRGIDHAKQMNRKIEYRQILKTIQI